MGLLGESLFVVLPSEEEDRLRKMLVVASSMDTAQLMSTTLLCRGEAVNAHLLLVCTGLETPKYLVGVLGEDTFKECKDCHGEDAEQLQSEPRHEAELQIELDHLSSASSTTKGTREKSSANVF